jgi:hypothetical protein
MPIHWHHEVEIFYVNCHELGVGCRDDTVEHQLDREEICCGRATVIRAVDKISAHHDTGAVGVLLFRSVVANNSTICDVLAPVMGDHVFGHEGNRFSCGGQPTNLRTK